jgi:hypothetical protein
VRRAKNLRLPVLVTLEAGFHLGLEFHRVLQRYPLHHPMAVGAGEPTRFMRAAVPIGAVTVFVAVQADGVVGFDLLRRLGIKSVDPAHAAPAAGLHMRRARAMAVFALHLSRLDFADPTHEGLFERCRLACMTSQANLRSDKDRVIVAAGNLLRSLGGCFRGGGVGDVPRIGLGFFRRRQFEGLSRNFLGELGERRIALVDGLGLNWIGLRRLGLRRCDLLREFGERCVGAIRRFGLRRRGGLREAAQSPARECEISERDQWLDSICGRQLPLDRRHGISGQFGPKYIFHHDAPAPTSPQPCVAFPTRSNRIASARFWVQCTLLCSAPFEIYTESAELDLIWIKRVCSAAIILRRASFWHQLAGRTDMGR